MPLLLSRYLLLPFVFLFVIITHPVHAETAAKVRANVFAAGSRFAEPLVASSVTGLAENKALLSALTRYQSRKSDDDYQALTQFLAMYPKSAWTVALETNLGLSYYQAGRFSKAIAAFEEVWRVGKPITEPRVKALVDRALGELLRMHARVGHKERLAALFAEMGNRAVSGSATEYVAGAKEGLWTMKNKPEVAYLCGPMALKNMLLSQGKDPKSLEFLNRYRSGIHGISLTEVGELAKQANLPYQLVKRGSEQKIPVPSVVHWKVNHYAAIIGERNGYYHVKDPIFGDDLWVTKAAIDDESSGHYLVPTQQLAAGWQVVEASEAKTVFGMGTTGSNKDTPPDPSPMCHGMCGYRFSEMMVSLNLTDTPVGYAPPIGLPVYTRLTYNQREANQPANFSFFNVGQKWGLNWLSYIEDNPSIAGANVKHRVAGGGSLSYSGYDASTGQFTPDPYDNVTLKLVSSNPIVYQRLLTDGGIEEFKQSNGATTAPRLIFLSKRIDAQGNALTFHYDAQQRLSSITDATARDTTFSYGNTNPLLITAITDPFGRRAQLTYDSNGQLSSITDVIGITSSFHYTSSLLDSLTTPYGITSFVLGDNGSQRWLEITDPLGFKERVEYRQHNTGIPNTSCYDSTCADPANTVPSGIIAPFNAYLDSRNSFYWDKHAFQNALLPDGSLDYTKARIKHWVHWAGDNNYTSEPVESIKYPNENRIWFNYPGQPNGGLGTAVSGTLNKPTRIGRVLDDGTTQLTQYEYNALGNVTKAIDPIGRETQVTYASNQLDVLSIAQKTGASSVATVAQYTYNSQHLPLTSKDAAGQTTSYIYNSASQLTKQTNPLNQSTSYIYNALGYLTSVVNANNATALTLTYTPEGNIASRTDSQGYKVQYSYDALDRLVATTYPDGTTRTTTYNKLDVASEKDRENRVTSYLYDANRNLLRVTDPMNHSIDYSYYRNGRLKTLTDENLHTTTWNRDIQSRVISKVYADGKQTQYVYETTTSRLKDTIDAKSQTKRLLYDKNNQVTNINYLNALVATPNVSFSYDPYFPRVTSMTDGTGTTQYQYKAIGTLGALQLATEDGSYQGDMISYEYDVMGRIYQRTIENIGLPNGVTVPENFFYDSLGRINNHISRLGSFNRSYLGQTGQLTSLSNIPYSTAVSVSTSWQYDTNLNDRRLLKIINSGKTRSYEYTRSAEDRISQIKETAPNGSLLPPETWNYTYDADDRLTLAKETTGNVKQYSYSYDPAGNITQMADWLTAPTNLNHNLVNQISSSVDSSNPTYDDNGNYTSPTGYGTLIYDAEDRLVQASTGSYQVKFSYDGQNRRRRATSYNNGILAYEVNYLWCGDTVCQKSRANSTTVIANLFSEGVEFIGGVNAYYAVDHLGTPRDLVYMRNGDTLNARDHSPYGKQESISVNAYYGSSYAPEFPFAGMQAFPFALNSSNPFNMNSSEYLTQYRMYKPSLGRWMSRDPIAEAGGINLYGYVGGNSVNLVDPLGLNPLALVPYMVPVAGAGAIYCALFPDKCRQVAQGCFDGFDKMFNEGNEKEITNSAGDNKKRKLVKDQDELLEEANKAAGGSLDDYQEFKPGWWISPDGKRKIEWNPDGHANTNEGPHVTVRDYNDKRYGVTEKIFIDGKEKY
jgi:RHS repeat-associated protein